MIRILSCSELFIIQELAYRIWPISYKDMISKDQIDYMLNWMYDLAVLQNNHEKGDSFYVYFKDKSPVGFIHLEPLNEHLKLQKLYVLPEFQKYGIGSAFLNFIHEHALLNNFQCILLQVNRQNSAVNFYLKNGFIIEKEEDFNIGNGFEMNDFVMKKIILKDK